METRVWRGQEPIQGLPLDADQVSQPLIAQVLFKPDAVQGQQLVCHDVNIEPTLPKVNRETRNIVGEAKRPESVGSAWMNRDRLTAWLVAMRAEAGSDLTMARRLGLKASNHIPALVAGRTTPQVATCLRLADAVHAHPSDVLRAAGYEDVIPLLENSYGRADLIRHTAPRDSTDAAALAARDAELAQRIDTAIDALADVALALGGETPATQHQAPAGHRPHRTAGRPLSR